MDSKSSIVYSNFNSTRDAICSAPSCLPSFGIIYDHYEKTWRSENSRSSGFTGKGTALQHCMENILDKIHDCLIHFELDIKQVQITQLVDAFPTI